jgi:endonuclease-3
MVFFGFPESFRLVKKTLKSEAMPIKQQQPAKAANPAKAKASSPKGSVPRISNKDSDIPKPDAATPPKLVPKPKTAAERKARLDRILAELDRLYPNVTCALNHSSPWQLLVATILSAQCTDERVNKVTPGLFEKYPTIDDLAGASFDEVANDIRSTGFFNNKAKSIIGAAQKIKTEFKGEVPRSMDELLTVPGAARKTANVVLGTAYGISSGVVVDTHVSRISQRLDLTREDDPVKIEKDLQKQLPQERWIQFSHQVIHFGRQICIARKPRCAECPLDPICYARDKQA